jgi:glycosyltransferase involved in cell wall biosynthesis
VIGATPLVVDLCDATSARLATNLIYASAPRRALLRYQMGLARTNERRLIARSEHLLFASARDRDEVLEGAPTPGATVLPNGVDHEYWRRTTDALGDEVVFSGAMHYAPNDDAARFLIGEVMPHVWKEAPETRVRVAGREPTERLLALAADDPRVTITGFVEDVRPHLEHGAVYAAPLRFASGIQNKLLEAMAMEIPVITSPVAAAGLRDDIVEPPILVVENDPPRFAREILAALARARSDPRPDEGARRFVVERFRWDRAVQILEEVLEGVRRAA